MILCVGEILADMLGCYKDGAFIYERNAGGAPFNVACAIRQFGGDAAFVGNVGDDIIGKYLIQFANERKLNKCLVRADKEHNTTLAFVELDNTGERSFCFHRKNTADYHLPDLPDDFLSEADIVYVGSLMLSEDIGFEYAENLVARAKKAKKLVAFDVNFRTDIFRDEKQAVTKYKNLISKADIVKFSEDEVGIFKSEYLNELKDKLICISLGSAGSKWLYRGETQSIATINVKPVDTTGAGDAFFAGALTKLSEKEKDEWDAGFISAALRFGNICGALNTQGKGAIAHLPSIEEINKYNS